MSLQVIVLGLQYTQQSSKIVLVVQEATEKDSSRRNLDDSRRRGHKGLLDHKAFNLRVGGQCITFILGHIAA